jgi:hypothetical protein
MNARITNHESRIAARFTLAQLMGGVVLASVLAWAVFPRTPVEPRFHYQTQRANGARIDDAEEYRRILADKIALLDGEESRK